MGSQSFVPARSVYIRTSACVAGTKEGEGPLGDRIDMIGKDDLFGCKTWEEAESTLQKEAVTLALGKAGMKAEEIRYLFAGDLLGQSTASSFGTASFGIPHMGVYGAAPPAGRRWGSVQWRFPAVWRKMSSVSHPVILPVRRKNSVILWPMATSGRLRRPGR